jgi:hypothetical protein
LQRRLTVLSVSSASCTHRACGARSMAKCLTCENEQGRGNVPNSYYVELAILITRTSAYACVCCSYSDVKVDNIIAFFFFSCSATGVLSLAVWLWSVVRVRNLDIVARQKEFV